MFYYRYRPCSETSFKELLYSEMYFSSPEECNDPFDSKTFYSFNNDKVKWTNLVSAVLKDLRIVAESRFIEFVVNHICSQCPITFNEALHKNLLQGIILKTEEENKILDIVSKKIKETLVLYRPSTRYFVSFSRSNSEPLMWSHYADRHRGFCLIFRSIDGNLKQFTHQIKRQIRRNTPNGLASNMSYEINNQFKFVDIDYAEDVQDLNAFLHMPVYVSGEAQSEEERIKIISEQENHYCQKHLDWKYEYESRLILKPPPSWLFGDHVEYSKQERLFHYEPSQLVGIIYGALMPEIERKRLKEILEERKEYSHRFVEYERIVFKFVEFEAKLSSTQRRIDINPLSIMSTMDILPDDPNFARLYKEWEDGVGHIRNANGSKRTVVN